MSEQGPLAPSRSPIRALKRALDSDIGYSFTHSPIAMGSAMVLALYVLAALLAPWIAPQDPFDSKELSLMNGFTPPLSANEFTGDFFLLGSDDQGRDVLSAIMFGSRISLAVGFAAVGLAMVIGVSLGLAAGFLRGWWDTIIMRVADVQLSFPSILVALLLFGVFRGVLPRDVAEASAIYVLILAIGLSEWVQFARVVRGATMVESAKEYIQAARLIGLPTPVIIARHILPNVAGPILVIATISLALAIIAEATLSFLGVGVPPTTPSLGTLIRTGQDFLFSGEWWIVLFPGFALIILALAVNLLGDWLRDAFNPKLR